jgi:aminoglycoside phosphotransferase (APT) family kinase protein
MLSHGRPWQTAGTRDWESSMALVEKTDLEAAREALEGWLRRKLGDRAHVAVSALSTPTASGFSNETLFFDVSSDDLGTTRRQSMVARLQADGPGLYPVSDITVQYRIMAALGESTSVPVPAMLWLEEDPSILGAPFFVMTGVDGRVPADDPPFTASGWVLDLTPYERAELNDNALRVLAEIHALDPVELGLEFLSRPELGDSPLDQEIAFYERYYAWAAEGRSHPTLEAAFRWIHGNRPTEPETAVLSWGDARIGNMIFGTERQVLAVLDWEMATIASPEQDLGWWLFFHRHHTEGVGLPHPDGFPNRDEVVRRYEELSGRKVRNLDFYEAFAALRGATIMVRLARMMIGAGLLSPEADMAENNGSSRILADLCGLPAPAGEGIRLISKS